MEAIFQIYIEYIVEFVRK